MREERLLERMSSMELDPLRREGHDQGRLVDSIVGHLRCILNTRQGCVPIAPDLGAPDFLDFLQGYRPGRHRPSRCPLPSPGSL